MEKIKRTKALKYIFVILCFLYVVAITVGLLFYRPLIDLWFSLFLSVIGSYMIAKGLFFRCDSSYLFGLSLYSSFIAGITTYYTNTRFVFSMYFLLYSVSFFILYIIFRQNIHLKSFAIIAVQMILLFLKEISFINDTLFWILLTVYLSILVLLFVIYLFRTKETKNGVQYRKKRL